MQIPVESAGVCSPQAKTDGALAESAERVHSEVLHDCLACLACQPTCSVASISECFVVSKASLKDKGQGRHSFGSSQSEAGLASQVALPQSAVQNLPWREDRRGAN